MKLVITGTRGIPNIVGGVETHCEKLYPYIAAEGFDVTVVRRTRYVQDALTEYKGVKLCDIKTPQNKSFEAIVHTLKAVWTAKFRLKADAVHIHAIGPAMVVPLARLLGLRAVFTHHGFDYDRAKWGKIAKFMLRLGERLGCGFANEVIVISEVINSFIKQKYNRQNAHLIYNGVPRPNFVSDTSFLTEWGIEPKKYIFAMGRFVPEKNFHQLIDVYSTHFSTDVQLVISGDADFEDEYSRRLKQQAKDKGVILTGFVRGEKLQSLLTHARAFVLPSSHEGLPISLLEAMSYGLPVLASNIRANLEIGLPSENYFELNNTEDMSEKLRSLLLNGVKTAYQMEKYDWKKIAEQTINVYKK